MSTKIFENGGVIGKTNTPTTSVASGMWSLKAVVDNISNWPSLSFSLTISTNQTNLNLGTYATSNGWDGSALLSVTVDSGVYLSSNTTATPALTVSGSFPNGVELTNNGFIVGMGGAGGDGADSGVSNDGSPGGAGGLALSVSSAITIDNQGTIAGGGGGGGGGTRQNVTSGKSTLEYGGCGGGGGRSSQFNSAAGIGGDHNNGTGDSGTVGTVSAAGSGGTDGSPSNPSIYNDGGDGGGWGSAGIDGGESDGYSGGTGGAAGAAVSGDSNITWTTTGTRLGAIT